MLKNNPDIVDRLFLDYFGIFLLQGGHARRRRRRRSRRREEEGGHARPKTGRPRKGAVRSTASVLALGMSTPSMS
eukprot:5158302-Pyramimonas_sp.AAC.1